MKISEAQRDMRSAYLDGGSGVLISGLVWLTAGIVALYSSKQTAFLVLFFGGMVIFPISNLVDRLLNRRGKHLKSNPLGKLALESTILIFLGLYLAYLSFSHQPNWLFPIMLMTIGVRYLIFQSIYGLRIYWVLGMVLIMIGIIGMNSDLPFYTFG